MSRRLLIGVAIPTVIAIAVCLALKSPMGAAWTLVAAAASLWSVQVTKRTSVKVADAMKTGRAPRAMMYVSVLMKLPVFGLIAYGSYRSGPVALIASLVMIVSVYSVFVWDAVARRP